MLPSVGHRRSMLNIVGPASFSRWFLARGFLYPEDEGYTFLRNVGSHKN
jgi:hypothetical protein